MLYLDVAGQGPGLIAPELAMVPASDRGFLYGDGLFETVLVQTGAMPLLQLHLWRLAASARELAIPCDPDRIGQAAEAVVAAHGSVPEGALRITLSRGTATRRGYEPPPDASPTLLITFSPYRRPTGPLRAITASLRVNSASPLARHKTLSALEKVLARAEAVQAGAEEALLLNMAGRLAEGAATNLFIRTGERWVTPPLSEGCLPGIMRGQMIALTGAAEVPLTPTDLAAADGVYLTNSLLGAIRLGELDGQPLAPGAGAPTLADLLSVMPGRNKRGPRK